MVKAHVFISMLEPNSDHMMIHFEVMLIMEMVTST